MCLILFDFNYIREEELEDDKLMKVMYDSIVKKTWVLKNSPLTINPYGANGLQD